MSATLDDIQIKITQDSKGASKAIDALVSSLEKLSNATNLSGVSASVASLSSSLESLSKAASGSNLGEVAKGLEQIPGAIEKFNKLPVESVQKFTNTLQTIHDIASPLATALKTMSESFSTVASQAREAANGIKSAGTEAQNVLPSLKKVSKTLNEQTSNSNPLSTLVSFATKGAVIAKIGKYMADSVKSVSRYIQTLHMASAAMGENAKSAEEFADTLKNTLGLNKAEIIEFQATFQNLFVGFGNSSKNAAIMSKNLTQLSYDMAAFYSQLGSDPGAAMEKLRLAMAGTIEPLQRLGYALKESDLKAVAARQGLKVNIRTLDSASKSMLRYIAVMEQSKNVQGEWGRSISSPVVAMASLKQSLNNISNEVGQTFLPIIMSVIPYIQAFTKGILYMVETINKALGIKTIKIEGWDKSKESMQGLGEEAEETGKAIKKAFTMGIDELNVFDSSVSSATEGTQNITGQLTLPEYDMLEDFNAEKLQEIQEKLEPLKGLFDGLAEAFSGFYDSIKDFVDESLYPWLVDMGEWMADNPDTMKAIGEGLGKVALGLLAIKAVGTLANLLGIPEIIKSLTTLYGWLTTNKAMVLTLAGVALVLWGAFKLVDSIINIITGTGDKWENTKSAIAGVVLIATGLAVALGLVTGAASIATIAIGLMAAWIITHIEKVISNIGILFTMVLWVLAKILTGVTKLLYDIVAGVVTLLGKLATLVFSWIPSVLAQVGAKITNWLVGLLKGLWGKLEETGLGQWLEEKLGITNKLDWLEGATEKVEDFGEAWQKASEKTSDELGEGFQAGRGWFDDLSGQEDILASKGINWLQDYRAEAEQNKADHDKELEDTSFWEKLSKLTNGGEDKGDNNGDTSGIDKSYIDSVVDKITGNTSDSISKALGEIEFPEIDTSALSEKLDGVEGTLDEKLGGLDETLGEKLGGVEFPEGSQQDIASMVSEQTKANEAQQEANEVQSQFNTSVLENHKNMQDAISNVGTLLNTNTNDVTKQLAEDSSDILDAIDRVKKACENIKIKINYYTKSGNSDKKDKGYATGGTPRSGEYFYARENGLPELVGRVGRQATVMNNGQIADTMAESLVRAMSQSEVSPEPTVIENKLYLDGEVVYTNQEKIKRSKGYSLGLGAFANV